MQEKGRRAAQDTQERTQMQADRAGTRGRIWDRLCGAEIVCAGPDSEVKRAVAETLARAARAQSGAELRFAEKMRQESLVLIFGGYAREDGWENFLELTETLEQARRTGPRRALFISDDMVYGKVFGEQRPLKEDEIGYLSHTAADCAAAQCMRTAEHLCFRLAREEGLSLSIVRADWGSLLRFLRPEEEKDAAWAGYRPETADRHPGSIADGGQCSEKAAGGGYLLRTMAELLLDGAPGEVYNLPGLPEELLQEREARVRERSLLSPVIVAPDTGKAENYAAS